MTQKPKTIHDLLVILNGLVGEAESVLTEPELMYFLSQAIHYLSTANAFRIALRRSETDPSNTPIEEGSRR